MTKNSVTMGLSNNGSLTATWLRNNKIHRTIIDMPVNELRDFLMQFKFVIVDPTLARNLNKFEKWIYAPKDFLRRFVKENYHV